MTPRTGKPLSPPRRAVGLLGRAAPPDIRDRTLDDLEELFEAEARVSTPARVRRWYWKQTFNALPPLLGERLYWRIMMIRNYALIALRNIRKQKIFSLINILGFAISLSLGLLVISILAGFYREDGFHDDAGRIYRVVSAVEYKGRLTEMATSPLPLRSELENLAGVESIVRFHRQLGGDALCGERIIPVSGLYADKEFFNLFSFNLDKGDPTTALAEPFSVVLTRELAAKFFSRQDPLGEVLTIGELGDFRVTGVVESLTHKPSHIRFELLASMSTLESLERAGKAGKSLSNWKDFNFGYVYVKLADKASPQAIEAALPGIIRKNLANPDLAVTLTLQRLDKISPGIARSNELSYAVPTALVFILLGISLVIMAIAGFNYMNLSVAKAFRRGREVGLRKVLGAQRSNLVAQFIGEAVVIALLSLVFAFALLQFLKPLLLGLNPEFRTFFRLEGLGLELLPAFLLFAVLTGIVAGLFPALFLSKFEPVLVLKDMMPLRGKRHFNVRKGLIVTQFFLSFVFLTTTIVGLRQVGFLRTADFGFNPAGILNVELQGVPLDTFKQSIAGYPGILGVSASAYVPNTGVAWYETARIDGLAEPVDISALSVDEAFLSNVELRFVSGRGFATDYRGEGEVAVLVNETAARRFGGKTGAGILGKTVTFENGSPLPVIGVVRDFLAQNFNGAVEPLVIRVAPKQFRYANLKLDPARIPETRSYLESQWKKLRPGLMFRSEFYEDQIRYSLSYFKAIYRVFGGIAFLAVFISLLGLLGMVVFETESRVKEIGIRRTLGATSADIFLGISRKFFRSLLGAAVAAAPVAWFLNELYLRTFITRIELGPWLILEGTALVLGLAALIIGVHAARAARTNPAQSLRNE